MDIARHIICIGYLPLQNSSAWRMSPDGASDKFYSLVGISPVPAAFVMLGAQLIGGYNEIRYRRSNLPYKNPRSLSRLGASAYHRMAWANQRRKNNLRLSQRKRFARVGPRRTESNCRTNRENELARKAQELENTNNEQAIFWQNLITKRIMSDMQNLAERLDLDPASVELFKVAHEGASVLEPPVLHSAVLYDRAIPDGAMTRCGGAWRPLFGSVAYPNLSWIGFNDRASAVRISLWGALTIWKNRWFRQRSAFLTGLAFPCLPLADLNFDNSASSAICWT